jgi:outer membrane protein
MVAFRAMRISSAILLLSALAPSGVCAADLTVQLREAPAEGTLVFQVYDAADTFGDLRDPAQQLTLAARGDGEYVLDNIVAGEIAVLVYHDENANGFLDKNFIGIPREALAISNNYRPKGPPSFARASFNLPAEGEHPIDLEMYRVLGERGRVGLGIGAIARSSPYVDSTSDVTQVIPAVTYVGERLQWLGPSLRFGLFGSDKLRVAAAAEYRVGAYEESDSSFLAGLGDRENTLLAGLGLQYEFGDGFELEALYQHDALDRIGGGVASVRLSRGFPWGTASIVPQIAYNWSGSEISNHDFGVPAAAATPERPAYELGSTSSYEAGVGVFVEVSEDWRVIINVAAEVLDDEVTRSPIVSEDVVVKGLAVVTYVF